MLPSVGLLSFSPGGHHHRCEDRPTIANDVCHHLSRQAQRTLARLPPRSRKLVGDQPMAACYLRYTHESSLQQSVPSSYWSTASKPVFDGRSLSACRNHPQHPSSPPSHDRSGRPLLFCGDGGTRISNGAQTALSAIATQQYSVHCSRDVGGCHPLCGVVWHRRLQSRTVLCLGGQPFFRV